jgi:hypothetical protein
MSILAGAAAVRTSPGRLPKRYFDPSRTVSDRNRVLFPSHVPSFSSVSNIGNADGRERTLILTPWHADPTPHFARRTAIRGQEDGRTALCRADRQSKLYRHRLADGSSAPVAPTALHHAQQCLLHTKSGCDSVPSSAEAHARPPPSRTFIPLAHAIGRWWRGETICKE